MNHTGMDVKSLKMWFRTHSYTGQQRINLAFPELVCVFISFSLFYYLNEIGLGKLNLTLNISKKIKEDELQDIFLSSFF